MEASCRELMSTNRAFCLEFIFHISSLNIYLWLMDIWKREDSLCYVAPVLYYFQG